MGCNVTFQSREGEKVYCTINLEDLIKPLQKEPWEGIIATEFKKHFLKPYLRDKLHYAVDHSDILICYENRTRYLPCTRDQIVDFKENLIIEFYPPEKAIDDELKDYVKEKTDEDILKVSIEDFLLIFPSNLKFDAMLYYRQIEERNE